MELPEAAVVGRHVIARAGRSFVGRIARGSMIGFASLLVATASGAIITADATLRWTENLTRTSTPASERDAYGADAHASAAWLRQLARSLTATTQVDAGLHATPKYELREHATLGIGADVRYKFGLGPMAPTIAAGASAAARLARLDQDTGWTTALRLEANKRVHPAVRLGAALEWRRHNADSATFDVSHREYSAYLHWDIDERLRLSHGHGRLEGNFTANAGAAIWAQAIGGQVTPVVERYYNSLPWEVTEIYGPGWVTYNVTGRARFWWVELGSSLGERSSLALRYEDIIAKNIIGIAYEQTIWSLSLSHRF